LLLNEPTQGAIVLDKEYMAELQRRTAILGGGPIEDEVNPEKILERDANVFFYDRREMDKLMGSPSGDRNAALPGVIVN
jgi:hypothetical protein